jgi:hypothetical protein
MTLDSDKIDQAVLALLYLGLHNGARAWKGFDWDAMNRLYERGFITDPSGKAKSVVFTEEGLVEARKLLEELFLSDTKSQSVSAARADTKTTPEDLVNTKDLIFQFRVRLLGIEPEIWRLIAVPAKYSFWDLHIAIQDAMGWRDCHLHAFRVADPNTRKIEQIGIPDDTDDAFEGGATCLPGWEIPIRDYFRQPGDSANYEYDFGDGWEHHVVLEELVNRVPRRRYPICLDGARACPPEDCGGIPGFGELLEVLGDPTHEEHDRMSEWVGGSYDPSAFSPKQVRFDNPKTRWRNAFQRRM